MKDVSRTFEPIEASVLGAPTTTIGDPYYVEGEKPIMVVRIDGFSIPVFRQRPGGPTMSISGTKLLKVNGGADAFVHVVRIREDFLDGHPMKQVRAAVAHELSHAFLGHCDGGDESRSWEMEAEADAMSLTLVNRNHVEALLRRSLEMYEDEGLGAGDGPYDEVVWRLERIG